MDNFLDKLKNFDLATLQETKIDFDLSQIDFKYLQASLQKRIDILLDIALIVATIFIVRFLFTSTEEKLFALKNNLTQLEEKHTAVIELEKQKKDLEHLVKALPQGFESETEIIKTVVDLADNYGVDVAFYKPTDLKTDDLYTIQTIDFAFESTYAQMLTLLRAIEKNKLNLRLNSWKKQTASDYRQNMRGQQIEKKEDTIKWEISLSSITLKNEK